MELDHLILKVNDVDESSRFYTEILGMTNEGKRDPFTVCRVTSNFTIQLAPWGTKGGEHLAFAIHPEFDLGVRPPNRTAYLRSGFGVLVILLVGNPPVFAPLSLTPPTHLP